MEEASCAPVPCRSALLPKRWCVDQTTIGPQLVNSACKPYGCIGPNVSIVYFTVITNLHNDPTAPSRVESEFDASAALRA